MKAMNVCSAQRNSKLLKVLHELARVGVHEVVSVLRAAAWDVKFFYLFFF